MKVIGTMTDEQVTKTLIGSHTTQNVTFQRGWVVPDLLLCVTRSGWLDKIGKVWCYIIIECFLLFSAPGTSVVSFLRTLISSRAYHLFSSATIVYPSKQFTN